MGPLELVSKKTARWFVPGDLDGAFGLFFSGFPDLLLIAGLVPVCGLSLEYAATRILPGVALSILAGNLFYAWQAHRLAQQTGRNDVTAIPFGVNTPTIFAYIFLIMLPVYTQTHSATLAWQAGVFASLVSGIVQTAGAFCTDWLRRTTPRAALLCPLAGIALAYLCLGFIFGVFEHPAVALFPAALLLIVYAARLRLPFRTPAGLVCMVVGAILAATLRHFHLYEAAAASPNTAGLHLPLPINLIDLVLHSGGWRYLSVILPMALLDTLVSLQILESVALSGDDYATRPSLLMNGLATLVAAAFGSPFPTTLYFGHNALKDVGARTGYSILSGATTAVLCLTGLVPLVLRFVPMEVVAIVVVWFGLLMVAQAFEEVPKSHAIAVAFGLIPMLSAWLLTTVTLAIEKSGSTLQAVAPLFGSELPIYGVIALSQGALLVSMVWAATIAYALDRRFLPAAIWMAAGAVLSFFGVIHAARLTAQGVENHIAFFAAPSFALSYAAAGLFLVVCHSYAQESQTPWIESKG
jgi:AGZA family xanthine/uracil permease-like MFS transporter